MRTKLFAAGSLLIAGVALTGCSSSSTAASSSAAPTSTMASTSAMMHSTTGTFAGLNDKNVAGTATVADGKVVLAGFSSDDGPDLHIYLTNGTDESAVSAGKEIGKIVYNQASQTFTIPGDVDASSFKDVVIHCDKAKAVFGAAPLA